MADSDRTLRKTVGERPRMVATAIVADGGYGIGLAVEDEPGYYKTDYGPFKTYDEARLTAEFMNERRGIDEEAALRIVLSSMGAENASGRRNRP